MGGEARDTRTDLIWQRCSLGMTWSRRQGCTGEPTAMSFTEAKKAALATGAGWHVPTLDELHSLIDKRCGTPPVDLKAFPDLRAGGNEPAHSEDDKTYWTSSEVGMARLVYYIDFTTGDVDGHSQGYALLVRLVRSSDRQGSPSKPSTVPR